MLNPVPIDRTPAELTYYVKRLEELAWKTVGSSEAYEVLTERPELDRLTYVEALEHLILEHVGEPIDVSRCWPSHN